MARAYKCLFTGYLCEHNLPISMSDHAGRSVWKMFLKCEDVESYGCGCTKTTAIIEEMATGAETSMVEFLKDRDIATAATGNDLPPLPNPPVLVFRASPPNFHIIGFGRYGFVSSFVFVCISSVNLITLNELFTKKQKETDDWRFWGWKECDRTIGAAHVCRSKPHHLVENLFDTSERL